MQGACSPKLIDDDPCVAPTVMAGLGLATHVFLADADEEDVEGRPSPAMTVGSMSRYQRALV
jgi:hypothetical protein